MTKTTTILRWWLALILAVSGLAWVVLAVVVPVHMRPFWLLRRVIGGILGAGMLSLAYFLAVKCRSKRPTVPQPDMSPGFKKKFLDCVVDGFLVFSVASFLFNLFLVLFRRYDFDPTFDVLHFIPTLLITNTAWEALISWSGGSLILLFSSVVVFDGLIGGLAGMILSPLRFIPRTRIAILVLLLGLFCVFEAALAKWLMFRC